MRIQKIEKVGNEMKCFDADSQRKVCYSKGDEIIVLTKNGAMGKKIISEITDNAVIFKGSQSALFTDILGISEER